MPILRTRVFRGSKLRKSLGRLAPIAHCFQLSEPDKLAFFQGFFMKRRPSVKCQGRHFGLLTCQGVAGTQEIISIQHHRLALRGDMDHLATRPAWLRFQAGKKCSVPRSIPYDTKKTVQPHDTQKKKVETIFNNARGKERAPGWKGGLCHPSLAWLCPETAREREFFIDNLLDGST